MKQTILILALLLALPFTAIAKDKMDDGIAIPPQTEELSETTEPEVKTQNAKTEEEIQAEIKEATETVKVKKSFFENDTLSIKKKNGERINFNVELAKTRAQQARGLMHRTEMAKDAGMLFIFDDEDERTFWMKNTLIPLDMLFVAKDGEIHHIHHNARPQDLTHITSEREAMAVFEINGGMSDKLGISAGDFIIHETFRNTHLQ